MRDVAHDRPSCIPHFFSALVVLPPFVLLILLFPLLRCFASVALCMYVSIAFAFFCFFFWPDFFCVVLGVLLKDMGIWGGNGHIGRKWGGYGEDMERGWWWVGSVEDDSIERPSILSGFHALRVCITNSYLLTTN